MKYLRLDVLLVSLIVINCNKGQFYFSPTYKGVGYKFDLFKGVLDFFL